MKISKFLKTILMTLTIGLSVPILSSCNKQEGLNPYTLYQQMNEIIDEYSKNGKRTQLENKWYSLDENKNDLDYSKLTGTKGVVKVGTLGMDEPIAYTYNHQFSGLAFEYLYDLCDKNDYQMVVENYSSNSALMAAVSTGKIDIAADAISITEERMQSVSFSHSFFNNAILCVIRGDDESIKTKEDLDGKYVGVLSETILDSIVQRDAPNCTIKRYNSNLDCLTALENNQVDAVYIDDSLFRFLNLTHKSLKPIYVADNSDKLGFVFQKFGFQTKSELNGKNIGILDGSIYDNVIKDHLDNPKLSYYKDFSSLIFGLQNNKIDAFVSDRSLVKDVVKQNPSIYTFGNPLVTNETGAAFPKTEAGIARRDDFNDFIKTIKQSGELQSYIDKWENYEYGVTILDHYPKITGSTTTITVSINALMSPYTFVEDGQYIGLEIELMNRYAFERSLNVVYENMEWNALIPSLSRNDIAISCINITPERAESVYFSSPLFNTDIVLVAMADYLKEGNFFENIANSFKKTFIKEERWKLFTEGAKTTLLISIFSIVIGLVLGFVFYYVADKIGKIGKGIMKVYTTILHNIPLVVILMIFYYIIFGKTTISGALVSIIVFSLTFSATIYSMLNTCVTAIDKGQFEGAKSLGYTKDKTFFKIILPQTFQQFFPMLKGEVVSHLKATAIVGYVAVEDLTKMSDIVRSRTYESFFPLIVTALIYFGLAYLLIFIVNKITLKVDPKKRSIKRIMKGVQEHD